MKKNNVHLLALGLMVFTLIACSKDSKIETDQVPEDIGYRVISIEESHNNQSFGVTDIEYKNGKLSKVTSQYNYGNSEWNFSYPSTSKIIIQHMGQNDYYGKVEGTAEITLTDNKVIEFVDDDEKYVISYNVAGQTEEIICYSDDGDGWYVSSNITFTYTAGKLVRILDENEEDGAHHKKEFFYHGENISETIEYYKEDNIWWFEDKEVYSYAGGLLQRVDYYNYNEGWVKDNWYEEYTYDNQGNLIKQEEINDEYNDNTDDDFSRITQYTYEKGSGNYKQIFGTYIFDYDVVSKPLPTKRTLEFMTRLWKQ